MLFSRWFMICLTEASTGNMGPKQVKGRAQVSMMDTGRGWRARKEWKTPQHSHHHIAHQEEAFPGQALQEPSADMDLGPTPSQAPRLGSRADQTSPSFVNVT